jgi:hypothetical protein
MRCFIFVKEIHKDNIIADLVVKRLKSYFFTKHENDIFPDDGILAVNFEGIILKREAA